MRAAETIASFRFASAWVPVVVCRVVSLVGVGVEGWRFMCWRCELVLEFTIGIACRGCSGHVICTVATLFVRIGSVFFVNADRNACTHLRTLVRRMSTCNVVGYREIRNDSDEVYVRVLRQY